MNLLALTTKIERLGVGTGGVATGGGTTTLIDTVHRTEADDYWNGATLVMLSGNAVGQGRTISDFVASTDTITVSRAFTAAIAAGDHYTILPKDADNVDVDQLLADTTALLADVGDGTDAATAFAAAGSIHSKLSTINEHSAQRNKLAPVDAAGAVVTASAVGTFDKTGAFVTLLAAITGKGKLLAVTVSNPSAPDEYDVEIAEGVALSEVIIGTVKVTGAGRFVFTHGAYITTGERLSARLSCNDAVARTAEITVEYIDSLT